MGQVKINSSSYGMPGRVVAVENGQVVWAGAIADIADAGGFDALFCHENDVDRIIVLVRSGVAETPPSHGADSFGPS